jgi:hypothetical protein
VLIGLDVFNAVVLNASWWNRLVVALVSGCSMLRATSL